MKKTNNRTRGLPCDGVFACSKSLRRYVHRDNARGKNIAMFLRVFISICLTVSISFGQDYKILPQNSHSEVMIRYSAQDSQTFHVVNVASEDTLYTLANCDYAYFSPEGTYLLASIILKSGDISWALHASLSGNILATLTEDELGWYPGEGDELFISEVNGKVILSEGFGRLTIIEPTTRQRSTVNLASHDNISFSSIISPDGKSIIACIQRDGNRSIFTSGTGIMKYDIASGSEEWRQTFSQDDSSNVYESISTHAFGTSYSCRFSVVGARISSNDGHANYSDGFVSYLLDENGEIKKAYHGMYANYKMELKENLGEVHLESYQGNPSGLIVLNAENGEIKSHIPNPRRHKKNSGR